MLDASEIGYWMRGEVITVTTGFRERGTLGDDIVCYDAVRQIRRGTCMMHGRNEVLWVVFIFSAWKRRVIRRQARYDGG